LNIFPIHYFRARAGLPERKKKKKKKKRERKERERPIDSTNSMSSNLGRETTRLRRFGILDRSIECERYRLQLKLLDIYQDIARYRA